MTRPSLSYRAHLAQRIRQLDRELSQPPLKGARRPSPAALQRTRLLRERTILVIQLRESYPNPTRITQALLLKLAYPPSNDIILSCPPRPTAK